MHSGELGRDILQAIQARSEKDNKAIDLKKHSELGFTHPISTESQALWYPGLGQRHLPENILAACIQNPDALVRNRLASSIATWTSAIRVFVLAQTSGQSFPNSKLLQLSLSDQ